MWNTLFKLTDVSYTRKKQIVNYPRKNMWLWWILDNGIEVGVRYTANVDDNGEEYHLCCILNVDQNQYHSSFFLPWTNLDKNVNETEQNVYRANEGISQPNI